MGAYLYAARSPKIGKVVEVQWSDGEREIVPALALAYLYKPSWYGPLDRELRGVYAATTARLERAWDGLVRPHCAVVADTLSRDLNPVRAKIKPGNSVMVWNREAAPLFVCDDPDWGKAIRHGRVVRIVGDLPTVQRPYEPKY